ncbi:threonine/serine exporter family protein [Paenibacillus arenilitoris]|uniref:Threonine/serine exporter family protein n=1 Tax=Paenibacillus arenilitoris TaxID=2772299 RepID=A0A927H801_9BACL|nr:threonine/serine exporter family protein [Paenibacillus arenilitoris]MBD2871565.1 threonine/serine exporter family protein [Paenibacillus arenilitoris]
MNGLLSPSSQDITQICLLAGKIMLQNGGETYRVEDTMVRIATAYGIESSHSFVTPTGIIFAIDGAAQMTRLIRISERSTNLHKVTLVNDISRKISGGELEADEAHRLLKEVDEAASAYPVWLQVLAAAAASGCFLLMFGGGWPNFLPVVAAGGAAYWFLVTLHRVVPIKFFAEFLTALLIGTMSVLFVGAGFGFDLDKIIIGAVMPLVPGLHITAAVRDLMAGHLVSGLSKGAEAFLTAFAIGSGIAAVLSFY